MPFFEGSLVISCPCLVCSVFITSQSSAASSFRRQLQSAALNLNPKQVHIQVSCVCHIQVSCACGAVDTKNHLGKAEWFLKNRNLIYILSLLGGHFPKKKRQNPTSIKNWMGPYQRTPKLLARAIGYSGFFGVRSGTVRSLEISWTSDSSRHQLPPVADDLCAIEMIFFFWPRLHARNLTNIPRELPLLKGSYLFQTMIFGIHVSFQKYTQVVTVGLSLSRDARFKRRNWCLTGFCEIIESCGDKMVKPNKENMSSKQPLLSLFVGHTYISLKLPPNSTQKRLAFRVQYEGQPPLRCWKGQRVPCLHGEAFLGTCQFFEFGLRNSGCF